MITPKDEKVEEFDLLKSIHNFCMDKSISKEINNTDNILIKYLKDEVIIKDSNSENLILFINELSKQIDNGNTIILPFIDPCYNLIEAYISNDNNNDNIKIFNDNKIFIQLINNSFINRKNLIPIYAYFSELYSDVENLTQSDDKLNNFSKYVNIWNLFYSLGDTINKPKETNSSFCFLGSGLELYGIDKIPENFDLNLKINFLDSKFLKYINVNDDFISTNESIIKYSIFKGYLNKDISSIDLNFELLKNEIALEININSKKIILKGACKPIDINSKKINILNNFYGQIKSIEISIFEILPNKNKTEKSSYFQKLLPYPLKDNGGIIFSSEFQFDNYNESLRQSEYKVRFGSNDLITYDEPSENNVKIEIIIKDINLVKTNYINYKEKEFNIIDYFGGIKQFLPFLNIINGLYNNKNIQIINGIKKENVLINFCKNIILIIFNHLNNSGKKKQENFQKYWNFYFYILNKIELFNSQKIDINIDEFLTKDKYVGNNFFQIFNDFLNFIKYKRKEEEAKLQKSIKNIYMKIKEEDNLNININMFGKTNNQLYRNIMKQLFIYQRLWSKQYLFFKNVKNCYKNNEDKNMKIKYKRLNYYTKNFQQPLIYPILEINNYYPHFKKFNIKNLYKNSEDKILNYDFSIDYFKNNLNQSIVDNFLDNNDFDDSINCCLIKKMYHINGKMGILQKDNDFTLIFSSNSEKQEKCNKKNVNNKDYNSHLCFGSVFSCLKKDKKNIIFIPKNKIVFILIRIYYYRPTGLEIFTSDNKSYYFNFFEYTKEKQKIFCIFFKNFRDKEINLNDKKFLGWYNPEYYSACFPLFVENINEWNEKKFFYSNFDALMIINLFSNRSFNDLCQYPVFPMLYEEIKEKRDMAEPIGFQTLTDGSKARKELIIDSYNYDINNDDGETDISEKSYFSLFYSNITYTCNFLIRVFPYSFIGIEYQGDGFDDPNRLFFSINSTFLNTLNQRADLRELIPEMFYFPPLFYNENEIQLKKISNGKEIDNVIIHDWEENKLRKYIFLKDMKNNLENNEKLNLWIDLIFGINMEFRNNIERTERYYNKNNFISFEPDVNIFNDEIIMQSYDFGVLPYKLFNNKFTEKIKIKKSIENEIYKFNEKQFIEDHINNLYDIKESFICKGEKGINGEYLKFIEKIKKAYISLLGSLWGGIKTIFDLDNSYKGSNIKYLFVGDVFGNLNFYKEKKKVPLFESNNSVQEKNKGKELLKKIYDNDYILKKSLSDHTSEIKYIDYNPRLNLVIDYALDGYINIYTIPKFKLIHTIQTKDFNINENIKFLVLISNPFPMICCICITKIYIFDINGKFINEINIETKDGEFKFCIDKNCGLFNDFISFEKKDSKSIIDLLKPN